MIRIALADDHTILRAGLRLLIQQNPDMVIVAEGSDGHRALEILRSNIADVFILDLGIPGMDGISVLRAARREGSRSRVVVLTIHDDPAHVSAALTAGAAAYLVKDVADTELISVIRSVHKGEVQAHRLAHRSPPPAAAPGLVDRLSTLSDRERQVFQLVARGFTNQDIGGQLGISVKSVETYRLRLCQKLGVRTRAQLVRHALELGLLDDSADAGS